jgi:calcineurin-like phosphoesterase family protein
VEKYMQEAVKETDRLVPDFEIYPFTYKRLTFLGHYVECEFRLSSGRKFNIVLSHYPQKVWNGSGRNWAHLHSHSHGGLPSSLPEAQEGKILEVSADVFPNGPVSLEEVIKIIDKKDHKRFDGHH